MGNKCDGACSFCEKGGNHFCGSCEDCHFVKYSSVTALDETLYCTFHRKVVKPDDYCDKFIKESE